MKNNNLPIHSLLKCLMLMTFGLFVVQGLSAKTFQKIYMFTYFEYDNTTGNNYVYSDDGTRWKVTSDGDVVVDEYNGKGVYISYGSELTLTSEKIFPASANVTVNAGAAVQVYADITVGVDGYTKDMSYSDTYQQYYSNSYQDKLAETLEKVRADHFPCGIAHLLDAALDVAADVSINT